MTLDHTQRWRAQSGTKVWIGAPANPMPEARMTILRDSIQTNADVLFAYIPQMYIAAQIDPPRQVIYLVLRDAARNRLEQVMNALTALIHSRLPQGDFVDILPVFAGHSWMGDVIRTGCVLCVMDQDTHQRAIAAAQTG